MLVQIFLILKIIDKKVFIGLRIGYGAFPLGIVEYMWRIKQPYNVSVAAEIAALAAINDSEYYEVRSLFEIFIFLTLILRGLKNC